MALSSLLKLAILLPKSVKGKNAFQSLRNCTITCDTKGTINFVEIVLNAYCVRLNLSIEIGELLRKLEPLANKEKRRTYQCRAWKISNLPFVRGEGWLRFHLQSSGVINDQSYVDWMNCTTISIAEGLKKSDILLLCDTYSSLVQMVPNQTWLR